MKPKKEKKPDITRRKESDRDKYVMAPGWEMKLPAREEKKMTAGAAAASVPVYTAPRQEERAALSAGAVPETAALPIYETDTYEAYAAALRREAEPIKWKEDKRLAIEETPLYKSLVRVRSGKSVTPTLEA